MTSSEWIKNKLAENGGDAEALKTEDMYMKFIHETGSAAEYQSYLRRIRENSRVPTTAEPATQVDYSQWDTELLTEIITEEVKEAESKLSLDDVKRIAVERDIPFGAFLNNIPNLRELIDQVYRHNTYYLEEKRKIEKLQKQVSELKKENKYLINQTNLEDQIMDSLQDVLVAYERIDDTSGFYTSFRGDRAAHLLISDVHFDELVNLDEMHGINEYNPSVAKQRIDKLFQEALRYTQDLQIKELNIKLLGDMVSGMIHEELSENVELGVTGSVLALADYLSQWIQYLRSYFQTIRILGLVGNHGRMHKKPRYKQRQTLNFDYLLYEFMRRELIDVVDEFDLPESFFAVRDSFGTSVFSTHGDVFKGGTGLNPVSGTWGRDLAKLNAGLEKHQIGFDIAEFGHFHEGDMNLKGFDDTKIIANGSIIGANEFSLGAVKRASRPSQTIYTIEEGKGLGYHHTLFLDN